MIPKNLGEVIRLGARRFPKRTALIFGSKRISYRSLDRETDRIAAGLHALGIAKGERVAVMLDNCPEFVLSYFAILKAGAVVVPVNYMFKAEEARYILQDSGAVCFITSRANLALAQELRLRLDSLKYIVSTNRAEGPVIDFTRINEPLYRTGEPDPVAPQDLAVLLYTSGTTGHPKGAMLTHDNLIANALDCMHAITVTPRDTFICILPLFHSFAATVCMNLPLIAGARIVLMKSVRPFKRVIRAIRRNRVTILVGVPSIYSVLRNLKLPRILSRAALIKFFNPLRLCISGAAALPAEVFRAFEKKFRVPLLEGYGLTEASPVVSLNPLAGERKAGSIGLTLSPNIEIRIAGEHGQELPVGETGELLVKGPNVMRGYYRRDEENASVIRDGWLFTGDMARRDADGYFFIAGRKKEMINVRGLNVYPREIEEVLYQHPKVKETAVIGLEDEHRGEIPKAYVVLKEGQKATEAEFVSFLRERLASYKVPRHVELRETLPKNTTGKILKRVLIDEEQKKSARAKD